ncbi:hypothetical protein [Hyphomonas oceanitis]|uniref:hypothetical protein n=1 Tax=Hyphomonas oceanitis TaxID=81033 RepID=UPI0030036501
MLRFTFAAALFALVTHAPASAEEAAACPARTEQNLYNLGYQVKSGLEHDTVKVFQYAAAAVDQCSDRTDVNGLAVPLLDAVAKAFPPGESQLVALSKAYEAVINNGRAWRVEIPSVTITLPDGSASQVDTYNSVTDYHYKSIIPQLLTLADAGTVHPMFSDAPLAECPFPPSAEDRVLKEAKALRDAAENRWDGEVTFATNRLRALRDACDFVRPRLTYELGELYAHAATEQHTMTHNEKAVELAGHAVTELEDFMTYAGLEPPLADWKFNVPADIANMKKLITDN